ncbi:MAG: ABC transporter ATP-binding protein [Acidimicrobiales bacterium]
MAENMLEVDDIRLSFGGLKAIDGCSFEVERGTITALIGPNGAGKSTTVNTIAGAYRPQSGKIRFNGEDITNLPTYARAQKGLIRTYQISREFGGMSVLENLLVVRRGQSGERLINAVFRGRQSKRETEALVAEANEILNTFGIYKLRHEFASNLSGGQKRLLELSRAVMAQPKMMLLDEPMAGVTPALIERLGSHMVELNRSMGMTFVLVEHNLEIVEKICSQVVVMALGKKLAEGTMAELRSKSEVIEAYLGGGAHERVGG